MENVDTILYRIKEKLNFKSDSELASYLNVGNGTISNWKSRNKVPFDEIFTICEKNNININYIFYGHDDIHLPEHIMTLTYKAYELNPDALTENLIKFTIENSVKQKLKNYDKSIPFLKYLFWDRYDTLANFRLMMRVLKKVKKDNLKTFKIEGSKQFLMDLIKDYHLGIIDYVSYTLRNKDKENTLKWLDENFNDLDAYAIITDIELVSKSFDEAIDWLSFKLPILKLKGEEV